MVVTSCITTINGRCSKMGQTQKLFFLWDNPIFIQSPVSSDVFSPKQLSKFFLF